MNLTYRIDCNNKYFDIAFYNIETKRLSRYIINKHSGNWQGIFNLLEDESIVFICYKDWNVGNIILAQLQENRQFITDNSTFVNFASLAKERALSEYEEVKDYANKKNFISIDLSLLERYSEDIDVIEHNYNIDHPDKIIREVKSIGCLFMDNLEEIIKRRDVLIKHKISNTRMLAREESKFCEEVLLKLYKRYMKDDLFEPIPSDAKDVNISKLIDKRLLITPFSRKMADDFSKINVNKYDVIKKKGLFENSYNNIIYGLHGMKYKASKNMFSTEKDEQIVKIDLNHLAHTIIKDNINPFLSEAFNGVNLNDGKDLILLDYLYKNLLNDKSFLFIPDLYFKVLVTIQLYIANIIDKIKEYGELLCIDNTSLIIKMKKDKNDSFQGDICVYLKVLGCFYNTYSHFAIKDIDNYLLIDNYNNKIHKTLGKGIFYKNKSFFNKKYPDVVYKAIYDRIIHSTPVKETINNLHDINYFLLYDKKIVKDTNKLYIMSYSSNASYIKIGGKKIGIERLDAVDVNKEYAIEKKNYIEMTSKLLNDIESQQATLF